MGYENLDKLIETVRILRSPQGCEWDRAQTHKTLRPNMLEEAYEAVDAIDEDDTYNLKEELGDVLLQVLLHSRKRFKRKTYSSSSACFWKCES